MTNPKLLRLDATRLSISNPYGLEATLFASEGVPVENKAIDELLGLLELQHTLERFYQAQPESFDQVPRLSRVAVTPDFHKAQGIPVGTVMQTRGFVIPQAIGNDINCGMRLHTTDFKPEQIQENLDALETRFRHAFFEGGRNIPMNRRQREALFTQGLMGLLDSVPKSQSQGLWGLFHRSGLERDLVKIEQQGSLEASQVFGLDDVLGDAELSRDSQIGSIGGGNHFVEVQYVEKVLDRSIAHAWGLREGRVTLMVHSGSVSVGHATGGHYREQVRRMFPPGLSHPRNKIFPLPTGQKHTAAVKLFWDALHNAANFAFANRMFLALMALQALEQELGEGGSELLYDAPHNLVWPDGQDGFIHRKGACPARGVEQMGGTPFAYYGEPVLVPGSMGASSFVLAGQGNAQALMSASHGAGRVLSRGQAARGHQAAFEQFMREFRVVSPLDLRRQDVKLRRDILQKKLEELKQEAPYAYKGIGAIVQTLQEAQIAKPVAELRPLMTVKG